MTRKIICLHGAVLLALVLTFSGCDNFFSRSWGTERDYDPSKIDVNADNVNAWIEAAVGNPKLAAAVAAKIRQDMAGAPDSPAKAAMQEAGVELALKAAGVGTTILSNASDIIKEIENENADAIKDLFTKIYGEVHSKSQGPAADIAALMDISNTGDGQPPSLGASYSSSVSASNVGQAVLVLAMAVLPDVDFDNLDSIASYDIGLKTDGHRIKVDTSRGGTPTSEELALAAYLNLIAANPDRFDSNPITSAISDAFNLR